MKKSYYRNKADRQLQELVRKTYRSCEVCGKPVSCGHHYYPKSTAGNLRYDWDNIIPICQGCHFRHHNGFPEIHNRINEKRGQEWLDRLEWKKHQFVKCDTVRYYKEMCEKLNLALSYAGKTTS